MVDGVGGSIKSFVRRRVLSKGKNAPIVLDAESFYNVGKQNMKTTVIHIPAGDIERYKSLDPFAKTIAIDGIFKMHIMIANKSGISLWRFSNKI